MTSTVITSLTITTRFSSEHTSYYTHNKRVFSPNHNAWTTSFPHKDTTSHSLIPTTHVMPRRYDWCQRLSSMTHVSAHSQLAPIQTHYFNNVTILSAALCKLCKETPDIHISNVGDTTLNRVYGRIPLKKTKGCVRICVPTEHLFQITSSVRPYK
jgi:hypothetical protein